MEHTIKNNNKEQLKSIMSDDGLEVKIEVGRPNRHVFKRDLRMRSYT